MIDIITNYSNISILFVNKDKNSAKGGKNMDDIPHRLNKFDKTIFKPSIFFVDGISQ